MPFADLEITLSGTGRKNVYAVELFYKDSDDPSGTAAVRGGDSREVTIDQDELRPLRLDAAAYGKALSEAVFADAEIQAAFGAACARAEKLRPTPLRLRLYLKGAARVLHALRWETLLDPRPARPGLTLATDENVPLSRYVYSTQYRPPRPRPKGHKLRLVVAVAAPADVTAYKVGAGERQLAPIDAAKERQRVEDALKEMGPRLDTPTWLAAPGEATLGNVAYRASGGCDILYLVCHGALNSTEPTLYLVGERNQTVAVPGRELIAQLYQWAYQPFVIVLASCQSAGKGEDEEARLDEFGALAALGPRLAEAGIPAVLAMQGNVGMDTLRTFMPAFFETLMERDSVDQAVAVARQLVKKDHPDWWMPVLFSRMSSGEVWYRPGLQRGAGDGPPEFQLWDGLLVNIAQGLCTPVLGPTLLEPLAQLRERVAGHWADRYRYPLAEPHRGDPIRMAQFVAAVQRNDSVPREQLVGYLRAELLDQLGAADHAALEGSEEGLSDLLGALVRPRARGAPDPYRLLAELPFRVYLTAAPDTLLEKALEGNDRNPQVRAFEWWNERAEPPEDIKRVQRPDKKKKVPPTAVGRPPDDEPLVYRLFGDWENPTSLVLSEDNHLQYLLALGRAMGTKEALLKDVPSALSGGAVLFLGFRLTDWDFRVLWHCVRGLLKQQSSNQYTNVAVQIDPRCGSFADPGLQRHFLEGMLAGWGDIHVFWGGANDFLRKLHELWGRRAGGGQGGRG